MGASLASLSTNLGRRLLGRGDSKILMLGLDAAGKTTLMYKMQLGEVETHIPTIGFNVEVSTLRNRNGSFSLVSWDVGGRDKIRALWRHYYRLYNDALIYVVDSNDRERLEHARDQLQQALSEDELRDTVLLVFANKQDLPHAMSLSEITEGLQLNTIRGRKWYVQPCCACSGDGLGEGLDWLRATLDAARKGVHEVSQETEKPHDKLVTTETEAQRKGAFKHLAWLGA